MNKFGNGIRYASAQRYLTTVANDITECEHRDGLFIPTNIVPGHFTQSALDNFDATTNIIFQYREGLMISKLESCR